MISVPALGAEVPRRGSRLLPLVGKVVLAAMGWRIEGEVPNVPKFVIAVAPHTSNWDFVVGVAAMFALDFRLAFLGKHTLFKPPFGGLMRWLGGIPVDRSSPHGVVAESVAAFGKVDRRVLVIAPEGTRRRVARYKPGFLHIARGAGVPVALAALDYGRRRVTLGPWFAPGADIDADLQRVMEHFAPIRGRRAR